MKALVILYSALLIFYCGILVLITLASSHHVDSSLIISNWACIISFTATIYLLIRNIFFSLERYLKSAIFFLIINCCIFIYAVYDYIKTMAYDSEKAFGLYIPVAGILFSLYFIVTYIVNVIKAEKG